VWTHAIEPYLDDYMGGLFERICRDFVRLYAPETLPGAAREVGQIWAAGYDIDVAGQMLDDTFFSGECKWWKGDVGQNVLNHLRDATRGNSYYADRTSEPHYLLFARSGFTDKVKELAAGDRRIHLVGPRELLGIADAP